MPNKIILIGDAKVGKSNIISRFFTNIFNPYHDYTPCQSIDYLTKDFQIGNDNIKFQIWDTGGQERFRTIVRSYYHNSIGAMIIYDITNRDTFNNVNNWYNDLIRNTNKIKIILIGNKCDLKKERVVSTIEGETYAKTHEMLFIETSALTSHNIDTAFIKIFEDVYHNVINNDNPYEKLQDDDDNMTTLLNKDGINKKSCKN